MNKLMILGLLVATSLQHNAIATPGVLEESEKQTLLYMREEEKLARDVYEALYEKWGLRPFFNIKDAEQRHMDALKVHIDAYGLKDPVVSDARGAFTNTRINLLYEQLLARGLRSQQDAIAVGIEIEETDIKDLQDAIKQSDEVALNSTYSNLEAASHNHLSAFKRWR